ncbi:hypothetical protein ACIPSE_45170 [Streptomyces sp. NPDC090106]|uniref:hypothetical protein n=1 Tax=Streptomyces sp. NPDC090106 TaxID=3365946 RepID=UPI0037FEEEE5
MYGTASPAFPRADDAAQRLASAEATMTRPAQQTSAAPDPTAALLYVCVERAQPTSSLAAERARTEGMAYAQDRGLTITEVIIDPYGEPDPGQREGWCQVRERAASGTVGVVIARWPACIAPYTATDLRHREISRLHDAGVHVRYSWAPLAAAGGEDK